uniref:Uncharacterized protein n=1 Tax=Siphoviridae sp. ctJ0s2 TaxID=2827834 RepID=A0A8S5TEW9_9CAUD|nr:MAG TPA: hypothetical protein [Siphoviridae sp. ctJ0s2]
MKAEKTSFEWRSSLRNACSCVSCPLSISPSTLASLMMRRTSRHACGSISVDTSNPSYTLRRYSSRICGLNLTVLSLWIEPEQQGQERSP